MPNAIEHITIVGGGTSGWLAAALLLGGRNRRNDGPDLRITLIESPSVPTVGVGEATTLSLLGTMQMLNIDEKDFMKACDASLKCAVRFSDWDRDRDGKPIEYIHPFDAPRYVHGYQPVYHYHRHARAGTATRPMAEAISVLPTVIAAAKSPRLAGAEDFQGLAPYSYHVDAGLLGQYLRTFCSTLGVEHIRDDVVDVELDERGFVTALSLKERGRHPVEFIVDCSGFQGLIVKKTFGEPFIDYRDSLPCDRAVALQVPYAGQGPIAACTEAAGLSAGWSWTVPLYSRMGRGYVYSSRHISDEAALEELRARCGPAAAEVKPNTIHMQIGRTARSWINNCVAVGLAGGFIEPLESTSIHFVQMNIRWLLDNFPDKACSPPLRNQYNRLVASLYEEIRDFIVMHYVTSNRDDTRFWRDTRSELAVSDTLREKLALWKHKLPSTPDAPSVTSLFSEWSYLYVLYGKRYFDGIGFPIEDAICEEDFEEFSQELDARRGAIMARAEDHREMLRRIHETPTEPWYRPEGERPYEPMAPALA